MDLSDTTVSRVLKSNGETVFTLMQTSSQSTEDRQRRTGKSPFLNLSKIPVQPHHHYTYIIDNFTISNNARHVVVASRFHRLVIGSPNAVLAIKIIRCIYLCSCVFMSRFGRDLNPIRDG